MMFLGKARLTPCFVGFLVVMLSGTLSPAAVGGVWQPLGPEAAGASGPAAPREPGVSVSRSVDGALSVVVQLSGVELATQETAGGRYTWVGWPEAAFGGEVGQPALPLVRRLFLAPPGTTIEWSVEAGSAVTFDLKAAGFAEPVLPMQAPVSMSPGELERATFAMDGAAYAGGTWPAELARVSELGLVRGRRLCLLEVQPVAYAPGEQALRVWPQVAVDIRFSGPRGPSPAWPIPEGLNAVVLNPEPAEGRSGNNYLIVVPDSLAAGVAPLVTAKQAQGFVVNVYQVAPGVTAPAIKAYIASLWGGPSAPHYILLVGDTDTIPAWTGGGAKRSTTDLPYGCMDAGDDWYPDIPVGRFALRTTADLAAAINKTLVVEGGVFSDPTYVKRAAFLATDDMASGGEETFEWIIGNYMNPAGFNSIRIYANQGGSTPEIANAVNWGCLYVTYFGHSDATGWWAPMFLQSHVRNLLTNNGLYGLALGFSCNTGGFHFTECLGETWLRVANKGSAAYIAASSYIYYLSPPWHETSNLTKFIFRSFIVDDIHRVRPAWEAALWRLLQYYGPTNPVTRDYFEMFALLGDPSLKLPAGVGFALSATPQQRTLCAPPTTQTTYTITVERYPGYNDPVTLTAHALPPGATAQFSVNGQVPPFTSQMTVGNLTAGSPGSYQIEVRGTSAAFTRSRTVGLHLSTTTPGAVALTSPPNNATNVSRNPTLTWQAATQAAEYTVQVARDVGFAQVVYTGTSTTTSHAVNMNLEYGVAYFWRVRASNGCGVGTYSSPFRFTTRLQPDYFTEQFDVTGAFDLDYHTITWTPDESLSFYAACRETATALPTNPAGGTVLPLTDNGSQYIAPYDALYLYGTPYFWLYVNANGNITFYNPDSTHIETLEAHFSVPRVSGLFDDLNPAIGGTVSYKEVPGRIAITWLNVPEWGGSGANTFQIELFYDGKIRMTWLNVTADDGIVGLSQGIGVPVDFLESDLSATRRCGLPGDLNCDGVINTFDIDPFVLALTNPAGYATQYPNCNINNADCNGDGVVNAFDIDPFVRLIVP